MKKNVSIQTAYESLANAIIIQAADDYVECLTLGGSSKYDTFDHIERFFRSPWFTVLTNVDGEYLIRELRKQTNI